MVSVRLQDIPAFGVAGNFTGHLEQAGEDRDFRGMRTAAAKAPKAIFPTYIPHVSAAGAAVPPFLSVFPFSGSRIMFPEGEQKLQIEPECAVICEAEWDGTLLRALRPLSFAASNDCSIRREGARKISEKKNWGACSKGLSDRRIPIDRFCAGGILDRYRIASFLVRGGTVFAYGTDSAVRDYSYFYDTLLGWAVETFNRQQDEGPAESVGAYLQSAGCPEKLLLSVGSTCYTDFGMHHFLQDGDRSAVIVYPEDCYRPEEIAALAGAAPDSPVPDDISALRQLVVTAEKRPGLQHEMYFI